MWRLGLQCAGKRATVTGDTTHRMDEIMGNALTELMDEWCAKYEACPQATQAAREAYRIIKDCNTVMVGMQYEIDAINEAAAGHIEQLQAKVKMLEATLKDVSDNDQPIHTSVQPSMSRKWRTMSERIDAGEPESSVMDDYGLMPSR